MKNAKSKLDYLAILGMLVAATLTYVSVARAAESLPTFALHACQGNESWTVDPAILAKQEDLGKEFLGSVSSKASPVRGFTQALALRRLAQSDGARALGEYWVARSLYEARLIHIARSGFMAIAARTPERETAGIQLAAIECLLRINEDYPTLALPDAVAAQLPAYKQLTAGSPKLATVVALAAHERVRTLFNAERAPAAQLDQALTILNGSGPYETLAQAFQASRRYQHQQAIKLFEKFFAEPVIPAHLQKYIDQARVELARSLYSVGEFERAAETFKLVPKRSNELANSLSELSWAHLMAEHYSEAIGTGMSLQAGGLRKTFTPEAPMVMAMALNELCQYPESIRAANLFRKDYEPSYRWLANWRDTGSQELYPQAVAYLKKTGKAPSKLASEWIRSRTFISNQEEINLIFQENDSTTRLGRAGAEEQRQTGWAIVKQIQELRPKIQAARKKIGPDAPLPGSILSELRGLKTRLIYYRRLQQAAPVWQNVLAAHHKQTGLARTQLLARINADLKYRSLRMLDQLEEVAENLQLIEVEIFNGASQDIIWQNAHPDYKVMAQKLKEERHAAQAARVWDWGRAPATSDENSEIWEDELGAFKADLFDNCTSKDKYLALKTKGRNS